jgi:hypothetical protein
MEWELKNILASDTSVLTVQNMNEAGGYPVALSAKLWVKQIPK